jgi:putative spermidine/putrescine transport system ATP-binding protein
MAFLDLVHVRKAFASSVAVEDFTLAVERGEFVSFLGPSGCGKTTVLRVIAGFERPTDGKIVIGGKDITHLNANKRNIGMVFQQYALFPNMNVEDNIRFGLMVSGTDKNAQRQRVNEMLAIIHMEDFRTRYPSQLSGGQQQRVALARALAIQPDVLLLDEPLSALDAQIRVSLRQEIRSIQRRLGITTIFVTHDQEEALSISDRIVVMSKGYIEQVGTPLDIYNAPQTQFVASFVGTLNVLTAEVTNPQDKRIRVDGQEIQVETLPVDSPQQPIAVAIRPESVSMNGSTAHAGNNLRGTVEDIYFLGSVVRIRTRLTDQFINVDTFNNPGLALPERGTDVVLHFTPESCRVLQHDRAAAAEEKA